MNKKIKLGIGAWWRIGDETNCINRGLFPGHGMNFSHCSEFRFNVVVLFMVKRKVTMVGILNDK